MFFGGLCSAREELEPPARHSTKGVESLRRRRPPTMYHRLGQVLILSLLACLLSATFA